MIICRDGFGDGGAIACCVVSAASALLSIMVRCFYQVINIWISCEKHCDLLHATFAARSAYHHE
jgi:hypothetical protein